ncbi:uncharacterized protein LOC144344537 [Saccoglossus kowalevskii]
MDTIHNARLFVAPPSVSYWTPPPGRNDTLDHYISVCRREIHTIKFNNQKWQSSNITRQERDALNSLKSRRDEIVIKPADKGGAVVVWRRYLYLVEAERQLSDTDSYRALDVDITNKIQREIGDVVNGYIAKGDLPKEAKNLIVHRQRTSVFYLLPKIHKVNNPGRPIVSACNCPTEHIARYLDSMLRPIVASQPTYVQDTNEALRKLELFRFTPDKPRFLFSMDVKSLYTSIPHADVLLGFTAFSE